MRITGQKYADFKFERNAQGDLIVMPPTGGDTGNYNFELTTEFGIWNRQTKLGVGFDSSTGFKLPSGAERSPDVAWIIKERWDTLTPEQQKKFPLAPQTLSGENILPGFILEMSRIW